MRQLLLYLAYSTAALSYGCPPQQGGINDLSQSERKQPANSEVVPRQEGLRWDGVSRLKGNKAPADLHRVADSASLDRAKRAEAIFSLFVKQLKIPQGAAEVGAALKGEKWLTDVSLEGVYRLAGWIPVEWTFEGTVFCLRLFPDKARWSDWVIYFRLSGGSGQTADEARAFLRGTNLKNSPKLVEFALCFPGEGDKLVGRIERFSEKGIAIYEPW
jgi:hypothetical protein